VAPDRAARAGGQLTGLAPGSRVAGYLIEELVGVGGMASVFRARDVGLGRLVALKLLTGDEAIRQRFAGEALAAAAVDHPNIIPVYAAGEADGYQYIAMRFVVGEDLYALARREGGLSARRTAAFISPVASALDAAHEAGLVHRDVKPANILVDARPGRPEHVYLSDFGVARHVRSVGSLTVPGQFLGTPDYAAPEQASGQPVDGHADQYALACVAYELLSGSVPFRRDEPVLVLYAHVSAPPPRLSAARPDLPAAADAVLAKALDKLPERRYDSCADFADALREALGFEPYDPQRRGRPPVPSRVPAASPDPGPGIPTRTVTIPEPATPRSPAPQAPAPSGPAAPGAAQTWTAVVTADHAYYDHVRAADDADQASISFPVYVPERRFRLQGSTVRIGRRSQSLHIQPEIDLIGPPLDPGVSRLHAALTASPDGTWSVTDLGSPNGIQVNGKDVPSGTPVPLTPGDQIHLGVWTRITLVTGQARSTAHGGKIKPP
jgi:serine/threonine protein kinase